LWNYVQTQIPEMAGNTTFICVPECGRNLQPNAIVDENNWYAYDHSDQNALRVFSLYVGPGFSPAVIGSENNPVGQVTDAMLTAAEVLGVPPSQFNTWSLASGTMSRLND
jgi:hypothetical protein